jgi:hypothetical protein
LQVVVVAVAVVMVVGVVCPALHAFATATAPLCQSTPLVVLLLLVLQLLVLPCKVNLAPLLVAFFCVTHTYSTSMLQLHQWPSQSALMTTITAHATAPFLSQLHKQWLLPHEMPVMPLIVFVHILYSTQTCDSPNAPHTRMHPLLTHTNKPFLSY